MFRSALLCVLIVLLARPLAAGPVLESGLKFASAQSAPPIPRTQQKNTDLYIAGLITSGIGGAMLGHGLGMPAHTVSCFTLFGIVSCVEEGGNRAGWIGAGAGLAGAGLAMAAIGGKRVVVAPSSNGGLTLQSSVSF